MTTSSPDRFLFSLCCEWSCWLEQWKSGNVSDFYPTFVDLLIMAEAKCMSHGVGGFGVSLIEWCICN